MLEHLCKRACSLAHAAPCRRHSLRQVAANRAARVPMISVLILLLCGLAHGKQLGLGLGIWGGARLHASRPCPTPPSPKLVLLTLPIDPL